MKVFITDQHQQRICPFIEFDNAKMIMLSLITFDKNILLSFYNE